MPKKGCSDILITPCYDGRILNGVHHVAGDGLSLISVKVSHHNCKFTPDPNTKKPLISCAHGIKARNSFWNLHKPDLSKVKGLQCATTESVMQLFQAHNVENAGKPSYKKRVLRLLGSLVNKKPKLSDQHESLSNNCSRPVEKCVLSSVCQEKEIYKHKILMQDDSPETTLNQSKCVDINQLINNSFKSSSEKFMETVYVPLCCSSNIIAQYSENSFLNTQIPIQETKNVLNNSEASKTYSYGASSSQKSQPSFVDELVSKTSLSHIATRSHLDCFPSRHSRREESSTRCNGNQNSSISQSNLSQKLSTEILKSEIVQSIFSDMFKEMQEIEDYISSYIGSFCVLEEEFDNYPAINRMPSVVSHFLDQVHSPTKLKTQQDISLIQFNSDTEVQTNTNQLAIVKPGPGSILGNINTIHSNPEKEENSYLFAEDTVPNVKFPGMDKSNTVGQSDDVLLVDTNVTQGNSDPETTPGYCYWEDIEGFGPLKDLTLNNSDTIESNNMSRTSASSIVPAQFYENIWKDFIISIENTNLQGLDDSQYLPLNENIAYYGHWADIFDQSIMEEAQNIVSSIDTFLDCEVLPDENFNHYVRVPCSIVEIDDADENVFLKEVKEELVCSGQNSLDNKQEHSDIFVFPEEECTQSSFKEDTIIGQRRLSINIGSDLPSLDNDLEDAAIRTENNVPSLAEINELLASIKKSLDKMSNKYVPGTSDYVCQSDLNSVKQTISSTSNTYKNTNNYVTDQDKISRESIKDGKEKDFPEINLKREISKMSNNILQENKMSFSKSQDKESRFVQISETCDGDSSETRSNLVFSSPKLQLNLTNPLRNINKK